MISEEQRKHIRFYPEPLEIALIDTHEKNFDRYSKVDPNMETEHIGLIENESHNGASLIMIVKEKNPHYMVEGRKWVVKLGSLMPMRAEVKWIHWIEDSLVRVGITLLD